MAKASKSRSRYSKTILPPIPTLSRIESAKLFSKYDGNNILMYQEMRKRFGMLSSLYHPFLRVLVFDPKDIRHILKDNAANYVKGRDYDALKPLGGKGLITVDGETWKRNRAILAPEFRRSALRKFIPAFVHCTDKMLRKWNEKALKDKSVEIHTECNQLSLEIVLETLFGTEPVDGESISASCHQALVEATRRAFSPIKIPMGVPSPANHRYRSAVAHLHRALQQLIKQKKTKSKTEKDLLSRLVAASKVSKEDSLDDTGIRDELITLLVAGHETTALGMTWTLYLLASNPSAQTKLFNELERVLNGRVPNFHDLSQMKYTRQVVWESLRLYPPVPALMRQSIEADTFSGHRFPAGTVMTLVPWVTHRDPQIWPSADRFQPERFNNGLEPFLNCFSLFPFAGGPRICVGENFAVMEMMVAVAMVIQNFRLSCVSKNPAEPVSTITLKPEKGIEIQLSRRFSRRRSSLSAG